MCGIIGIVGTRPAAPILIEGLKSLEYRGYDSAGIATLNNGSIGLRRASGKIANLADVLQRQPLSGEVGIGHTRWATHGPPNEANAHPQVNERVAVVHNGIIENHLELRAELEERGYTFKSDTDTEVIAHLISDQLACQLSPQDAVSTALKRLEGAFALAIIFAGQHDLMIAARRGSPLALGFGEGEGYLGSDALALSHLTGRICYLDEGDWAEVTPNGSRIYDAKDRLVERPIRNTSVSSAMPSKDGYRHYMQKEIFEQPSGVGATLESLLDRSNGKVTLPPLPFDLATVSRFTLSACGTSFYAVAVAKYWFEQLARQPVEIDIASEFRYREAPLPDAGVSLFVSQSGETIDTLAALRFAKSQGQPVLSIVNVPESAIARESDVVLQTLAGPEIGVASTKAFTTQLAVLASLALATAQARQTLDEDRLSSLTEAMISLPAEIDQVLQLDAKIRDVAASLVAVRDVLYLGRGALFPIAMEGALKLKELSYIHSEGYAAGEMKHGPIALIDEKMPVIVCAPSGPLFEKTAGNVQEVLARGGRVTLLTDPNGANRLGEQTTHCIVLPEVDPFIAPVIYSVPVQLLAYHTAALKGTDVDQPRNLAKSVTVE